MPEITDIWVKELSSDLMVVTIRSGDTTIDSYEAYATRSDSLDSYLANKDEINKSLNVANGRFSFPEGYGSLEDRKIAHKLSEFAKNIHEGITSFLPSSLGKRAADIRTLKARQYYEQVRPIYEGIISQDPEINDYQIAKRLNELGSRTFTQRTWHLSNVRGLRDYLENNASPEPGGMER